MSWLRDKASLETALGEATDNLSISQAEIVALKKKVNIADSLSSMSTYPHEYSHVNCSIILYACIYKYISKTISVTSFVQQLLRAENSLSEVQAAHRTELSRLSKQVRPF